MNYLGGTKFACHTGNALGVILVALNFLSLGIVRNLWTKSGFTRSLPLNVSLFDHQHGNSCFGNLSAGGLCKVIQNACPIASEPFVVV
jgi:hypothetical protein